MKGIPRYGNLCVCLMIFVSYGGTDTASTVTSPVGVSSTTTAPVSSSAAKPSTAATSTTIKKMTPSPTTVATPSTTIAAVASSQSMAQSTIKAGHKPDNHVTGPTHRTTSISKSSQTPDMSHTSSTSTSSVSVTTQLPTSTNKSPTNSNIGSTVGATINDVSKQVLGSVSPGTKSSTIPNSVTLSSSAEPGTGAPELVTNEGASSAFTATDLPNTDQHSMSSNDSLNDTVTMDNSPTNTPGAKITTFTIVPNNSPTTLGSSSYKPTTHRSASATTNSPSVVRSSTGAQNSAKQPTTTTPKPNATQAQGGESLPYDKQLVIIFGTMAGLMLLLIIIGGCYKSRKRRQQKQYIEGGGDIQIETSKF